MNNLIVKDLHDAGITVSKHYGTFHFRCRDDVAIRTQRMSAHQRKLLSSSKAPWLAYLTLLDLSNPEELPDLFDANLVVHRALQFKFLERLSATDEPWRVSICDVTALALPEQPAVTRSDIESLCGWLQTQGLYSDVSAHDLLRQSRLDQLAWAFVNLPPAVFSVYCGLVHTTPLEVDAMALRNSDLVVKCQNSPLATKALLVPSVLDFVAEEKQSARDHNRALLQQAIDGLITNRQWTQQQHIESWVENLWSLTPRLQNVSDLTIIIFGWICDLVQFGTSKRGERSRCQTRRKYINATALGLLDSLGAKTGCASIASEATRRRAFRSIVKNAPQSDQQLVCAAIASFQQFLDEYFDLDPVYYIRSEEVFKAPVRAQFVPPQCIQRALSWIDDSQIEDQLFRLQLSAALAVGANSPLRLNELLHARFCNLYQLEGGGFELEVTSRPGWRDIKTDNSRRRVHIDDPDCCARVSALLEFRRSQGYASTDLIFSSALHPDVVYRKHYLHGQLLALLKAATGDDSMTFHALRHTWACRSVCEVFTRSQALYRDPLAQVMVNMGHGEIGTTLTWYFHLSAELVRVCVDQSLDFKALLTGTAVDSLTGKSDATLRQQSVRSGTSLAELRLKSLGSKASSRCYCNVAQVLEFGPAIAPQLSAKSLHHFSARTVLDLLRLVAKGEDAGVAGRRLGLEATTVAAILKLQTSLSHELSHLVAASRLTNRVTPALRVNYQAALQEKHAALLANLEHLAISDTVRKGVSAWRHCRNRYGHIAMTDISCVSSLLKMLAELGAQTSNLCLRVVHPQSPAAKLAVAHVSSTCTTILGGPPRWIEAACDSPQLPLVYLAWTCPQPKDLTKHGPVSERGLEAILFCLHIYVSLKEAL